jgi:large subunit ribosomal protein L19e
MSGSASRYARETAWVRSMPCMTASTTWLASVGPFAASRGILPRYAACSADDHAGVGVAAATRMAGAAAWVVTAARMARPGRLAAAPGRLGVLGAGRHAAATVPATAAAASPAAAAGAATPPATAAAPPAAAAAAPAAATPPAATTATPPATAAAAPPVAAAAASTPAANRGAVQARPGARDLVRPDSVPRAGRPQCR